MTKKLISIISILIFTGISGFTGQAPGSSSFEFLLIPIGAREIAMGSGSAIAHGPNAFWWNPAGLGYLERKCVSLMYNKWFQDITQQRAGISFPMKYRSVGAINISLLSITGIEGYSWNDVPTGELKAQDFYLSYTQAKRFTNKFTAGMSMKVINEKLASGSPDEASAFAMALDLGMILQPVDPLWLSAGIRNAGISGKFEETTEPLPFTVFTGFGLKINKFILISSDFMLLDNTIDYGAGAELDLWDILFLRAGFNSLPDFDETFRLGAGWRWKDIHIDFVRAPYGELGNTMRVDLNIMFGKPSLTESIYRKARKLYKTRNYKQALVEFSKVSSLLPRYKKVKNWIRKTKDAIRESYSESILSE